MKRLLFIFLSVCMTATVLLTGCGKNEENSSETHPSETTGTSVISTASGTVSETETTSVSESSNTSESVQATETAGNETSVATKTPDATSVATSPKPKETIPRTAEELLTPKIFDNFDTLYIKAYTLSNGTTATKEMGQKDGNVYSSVEANGSKIIYYSNDRATFILTPDTKSYVVDSFTTMKLDFIYDKFVEAGIGTFNDMQRYYEKFADNDSDYTYVHYFNSSDEWLGFDVYYEDKLVESTLVVVLSKNIPSHIFFEIPEDYHFYFEEPVVTWPQGWNEEA